MNTSNARETGAASVEVGDGSDWRPIWKGVNAETGHVYLVFANGLAQGFGDGHLHVTCGLGQPAVMAKQTTRGRHIVLDAGDSMTLYEVPDAALTNAGDVGNQLAPSDANTVSAAFVGSR